MPKISQEIKNTMAKTKIIPVATASKDGMPNVIPFAFVKCYDDETLVLADNFMQKSMKNLEENPFVSICVWDTEGNQSFQIKGKAAVETEGKVFNETVAWVKEAMPQLSPKSAILVKISNIYICQPGPDLGKEL
ncbi:pyridoxamine 5'-phosphate oxidase family protein [Candidatus Formimonas warabiya]|uniref:Pyridoxamine 5'-phosphate oxidase n=1 Tax=Formimonas warabiya TaxID=1761012 RepID=A0A3G1KYF9_FORW1|nr:pyridoxamine 5'-phosphate oxidase [Candidatus Formimonas warabiya]